MRTNPKGTITGSVYTAGAGLALLLAVLWLLGNTDQAYACKCVVPGSPDEEIEKFDVVFAGRVLSVHHSFDPNALSYSPGDITTVGFRVSTVWKGAVEENMMLTTPPTGGSCGFAFVEAKSTWSTPTSLPRMRPTSARTSAAARPCCRKRKKTLTPLARGIRLKAERSEHRLGSPRTRGRASHGQSSWQ